MTRFFSFVCAVVLLHGVAGGQTAPPPPRPEPPVPEAVAPAVDPEADRMRVEYLSGDADRAVAYFAGRKMYNLPPSPPAADQGLRASSRPSRTPFVSALFATEVGMRLRTFGKYAMSAPLETNKKDVVGLNGAFELNSFSTYRSLPLPPQLSSLTAVERRRIDDFVRQWHVVTISHCSRWQLDCADTLFASAELYFGQTADVFVLASSRAEARGASGEAQALLQRALAIDGKHVSAHLRLGRLLAAAGRPAEAERELTSALDLARADANAGAAYFALTSLADLDARAGRAARARVRRTEASALKAFDHPCFADLQPPAIYRAGLLYEQPQRIAVLRSLAR